MNSKKLFSVILSGLFALTLVSCDFGSDDETKKAGAEEINLLSQAMGAIYLAEGDTPSSKSIVSKATVTETYSYTGTYWNATGTYTYDDVDIYPYTIDMTFTWKGYTCATYNVTLVRGTVNYYLNYTGTTYTYNYSGEFVMTYEGVTYDITWDIAYVMTSGNETYSGTFTINGEKYKF